MIDALLLISLLRKGIEYFCPKARSVAKIISIFQNQKVLKSLKNARVNYLYTNDILLKDWRWNNA